MKPLNENQKQLVAYCCVMVGIAVVGAVAEMLYLRQLSKIGKVVFHVGKASN